MITVCPGGWAGAKHPEKVLRPEDGRAPIGKVSHGMCQECKAAVDAELDEEEQRLQRRVAK